MILDTWCSWCFFWISSLPLVYYTLDIFEFFLWWSIYDHVWLCLLIILFSMWWFWYLLFNFESAIFGIMWNITCIILLHFVIFITKNENISISFIFFFFYSHTLLFTSMSCLSSKVISMLLLKDEVNIDFHERVHIHLDKIMN